MRQAGKAFFFEKKKQKAFVTLSRFFPSGATAESKVFWFFFSKKNCLPCILREVTDAEHIDAGPGALLCVKISTLLLTGTRFHWSVRDSRGKSFLVLFRKKELLAFLLPLTITSCNLAPHYHVPLTAVPVAYKEATAFQPAAPSDGLKRGDWWGIFGDPVLDDLESHVDGGNPTLAVSLAALDQARGFAAEAQAGLYPTLSLGGQINEDRQSNRRPTRRPGQPNQYLNNSISTQANYEVDVWERTANAIRAGRAAAQASAADLETIRLSLHAELASDYVELRGYDAQARVLESAAGAYRQAVRITHNRFVGKIASSIDVARAETQLDSAEAAIVDTAAKRALVEHAIAVLVGRQPSAFSLPPSRWTLALPDISPGLPSTLLERRADVAAAERQMAAANDTIGVTRAAFYPNFSLSILYGLQDTGFQLFSLPNDFWAIGPGVALPLFEGGLRDAELGVALAQFRQAEARYRETVLAAFQSVEDELSQLRLLAQETHSQDAAVRAAQQTEAMTTNLYTDGATNFLDVVIAQTAELQSEQAATDLRTRRVLADVALVRALGGGWTVHDLPAFKGKMLADKGRAG